MWEKVFITVFIIGGLNGLLAVFLVIAEHFLANYGECTITINKKQTLHVQGGASLLTSLKSKKIYLPSACGGRGTCAYCKCQVLEGGKTILPTEESLLTQDEIDAHIRLSCQIKVKNDLHIIIPEGLFQIKEFRARISEIKNLTYDIKLLHLQLLDPGEIYFTSGQYIQLQNKPYEKVKGMTSRAYSIASKNTDLHEIDLMVRLVPEGIVTSWIHQYLKEGDEVTFTGPMGNFHLHEGESEIIMIAGGSGMAPMVSILEELVRMKTHRKVTYFFGAVAKKDLFYVDEMERFEREILDFTFVPTLSQPESDDNWHGTTGLITVPVNDFLEKIDTDTAQAYLCGSPGMINACIHVLSEGGITNDRIFFDPFI
jgi:Na+-transporting NADH:ubiquinone oxidoreductase subunit F